MRLKIAEQDIASTLEPLGFQMQSRQNDVTFVRPNATIAGLFERVECMYAGRTIVLSVALSVVQHAAVQWRGLIERDGWPEVCTDPENGRVAFQKIGDTTDWLALLVDRAPERFERLVRERGDTLLARTKDARERAGVVTDTIVRGFADALREPFAGLTEQETKLATALMQLPLVVSSEELRAVYGVAIAALVRSGDDAIAQTVNAPTPIGRIARLMSVPDDLIWRIRLLVDRILIWRADNGRDRSTRSDRRPIEFTTLEVSGRDAVRLLEEYRSKYRSTGQYPFLIGDGDELERLEEQAELAKQAPAEVIRASLEIGVGAWIAGRREEQRAIYRDFFPEDAEEYEFSDEEPLGEWPIEVAEKGSISLHKDIVSGEIKSKVYLGLAKIEQPWQLPAVIHYGGWNNCPFPEVHCAFHRSWQERFGAEITGMSGDVVECVVRNPPRDRETALGLAWEQSRYCSDIVDQGCGSISNLAATLLNSPYWFFWWD